MRIVIGIDGSEQALTGVGWVTCLPLSPGDEVILAAVAQPAALVGTFGYVYTAGVVELTEAALRESRERAQADLSAATARLQGCPAKASALVVDGHPVDALSRLAEESQADLLVVGPHGRGRLESLFLGSISQGLLQTLPTSLLVARAPVRPPERVLLALDGSEQSLAAARWLTRLPLPGSARVDALVVTGGLPLEVIERHRDLHGRDDEIDLAELEERTATAVLDAAEEVLGAAGITLQRHVRHGDAKIEILDAAAELGADLIVTGARGLGGFKGLILGSVSRAVSRAATCSTLVAVERPARDEAGS